MPRDQHAHIVAAMRESLCVDDGIARAITVFGLDERSRRALSLLLERCLRGGPALRIAELADALGGVAAASDVLEPGAPLVRWQLVAVGDGAWGDRPVALVDSFWPRLCGHWPRGMPRALRAPASTIDTLVFGDRIRAEARDAIEWMLERRRWPTLWIQGPTGTGRGALGCAIAAGLELPFLLVPGAQLGTLGTATVAREAIWQQAAVVVDHGDDAGPNLLAALTADLPTPLVVTLSGAIPADAARERPARRVTMAPLDRASRARLWRASISRAGLDAADDDVEFLASRFRFGPAQIEQAIDHVRDTRTGISRADLGRLPPAVGWQQRGSESTFRGAVMERAALAQLEAESAFRIARGEISGTVRIPHAREGGGFDHVFVEFTGTGAATRARIRIIEVKDYPGRSVPLGEFTAITGTGLTENLRILRNDARAARDAIRAGVALPPSFAALGLDPHQLDAIHTALRTPGSTTVEVMVGPTTRIGAEGHHAAKVLPAIRRDVDAALGAGAFRTIEDGEPTTILQSYADMANAAETAARASTRTGP